MTGGDELRELMRILRGVDDQITPEHVAQRFRELLDRVDSDPDEQARIDAIVAQITDDDIEERLRRVLEAAANDDPEDTHDGPAE